MNFESQSRWCSRQQMVLCYACSTKLKSYLERNSVDFAGPFPVVRLPRESNPSRPKAPIKSLSDLIFGLALSIGTISLIAGVPKNPYDIAEDLLQFGFSFLILISVWMSYSSIISVLPLEDQTTIMLNIVLLFLVSIEPYLFWLNATYIADVLKDATLLASASSFYAIDMAGLMVIIALFAHQLSFEEKKLVPPSSLRRYRKFRNTLIVSACIFMVSILPQFWSLTLWGVPLRFLIWFVPVGLSWVWRIGSST